MKFEGSPGVAPSGPGCWCLASSPACGVSRPFGPASFPPCGRLTPPHLAVLRAAMGRLPGGRVFAPAKTARSSTPEAAAGQSSWRVCSRPSGWHRPGLSGQGPRCALQSSPVPARCAARAAASGCTLDRAGAQALMKAPQTLIPWRPIAPPQQPSGCSSDPGAAAPAAPRA